MSPVPEKKSLRKNARQNYWATRNPDHYCIFPKNPPLAPEVEQQLFTVAQRGELTALNHLWCNHLRLVLSVVNLFECPEPLLEDVIQEGVMGIRKGIARYQHEKETAPSTYIWYWIYQSIQRFLYRHRYHVRIPSYLFRTYRDFFAELDKLIRRMLAIYKFANIQSIHELPADEILDKRQNQQLERKEVKLVVRRLLKYLQPKFRYVVIKRYGLGKHPPQTLRWVAKRLKISHERVRQIEQQALEKLRWICRKNAPAYVLDE
ncbi:MAG: sigma-70 family RNA polymerase sigma factor [Zavarzinella sp.]